MSANKKILGIDFGSKRIGLALSDENGEMAFPLQVVKNDSRAVASISEVVKLNLVSKIVIGESKDFLMKDNPIMTMIREFEISLYKETNVEIVYEPEFLTSHQAQHLQGKNDLIDASAATIILQSYIDRQKHNS